jgi:hypothetical protein
MLQSTRVAHDGDCAAPEEADEANTPPPCRRPSTVLYLSTQTGDDILTLRGPGDKIVAQEHWIARSGPASVKTTHLVSINVDKLRRRGTTKKQVVVEGALEVPKDALHSYVVGLTRVMHVETPSGLRRRCQT